MRTHTVSYIVGVVGLALVGGCSSASGGASPPPPTTVTAAPSATASVAFASPMEMVAKAKAVTSLIHCDVDYTVTLDGTHDAYCFAPDHNSPSVMFSTFTTPGQKVSIAAVNAGSWVIDGGGWSIICADDRVLRKILPAFPGAQLVPLAPAS